MVISAGGVAEDTGRMPYCDPAFPTSLNVDVGHNRLP